jgi:hypothetical protein
VFQREIVVRFITYEAAEALTLEERIALARRRQPDIREHIYVIEDDNMLEWNGRYDRRGWEVFELVPDVREWCEVHLAGEWQYRSVLYAQGRSMGADYFLHFIEFERLQDAVHFQLRWR